MLKQELGKYRVQRISQLNDVLEFKCGTNAIEIFSFDRMLLANGFSIVSPITVLPKSYHLVP